MAKVSAFILSSAQAVYYDTENMVNLKELGDRLRQLRLYQGLSQKQLAAKLHITQSAVSRLENGEEVHASALLAVLLSYENKVSFDEILSSHFNINTLSDHHIKEATRQLLSRHLDIIKDAINQSNETCLQQLELLQNQISK